MRDPGRLPDFSKSAWFQVAYNDGSREWILLGLKTRVLSRARCELKREASMDMYYYQEKAEKTAIYPKHDGYGLLYTALGLTSEAGEVAGKVKKILRDSDFIETGKVPDERVMKLESEIGDVLWYLAQLSTELGLDLGLIAERNLNKLEARQTAGTLRGDGDER